MTEHYTTDEKGMGDAVDATAIGADRPAVTVVGLDYRSAGVGRRLGALQRFEPALAELKPRRIEGADISEYLMALIDTVSPPLERVVLVTYCAAFGLAGEFARMLDARGGRLEHVVAVDPVIPTARDVREAYREILDQLGSPDGENLVSSFDLSPARVAGDLDAQRAAFARSLSTEVHRALGTDPNAMDTPEGEVARQLLTRYETLLQYVLCCYGASRTRLDVPTSVLGSNGFDMSLLSSWTVPPRLTAVCDSDAISCECLGDLVRRVIDGNDGGD